ncbi:MAG: hypothetical protein CL674_01525 [Bdellovibrionaceae bacterium]|nr:hypothetical protein [Pseudobdellovibrionaceae bacterium]
MVPSIFYGSLFVLLIASLVLTRFQNLRIHLKIVINLIFIVGISKVQSDENLGRLIFIFLFINLFMILFAERFLPNAKE